MPAIKIAALLLVRIHTFMNTKKWNRNRNMFYLLNIITINTLGTFYTIFHITYFQISL